MGAMGAMGRALIGVAAVVVWARLAHGMPQGDAGAVVESRITWIGLFKNGLAVVRRRVELPGAGSWEIADVPEPVHGTLWIESAVPVTARVTQREVEMPLDVASAAVMQHALAGREVTVHMRGARPRMITGRVVDVTGGAGGRAWDRRYERERYAWWSPWESRYVGPTAAPARQFLTLETDGGTVLLDAGQIAQVALDAVGLTTTRRLPVLRLETDGGEEAPLRVGIMYLAKGMAWAPSYRVDISDRQRLTIEQKAVIRNELEDFDGAHVELISGFPSVEFSHVLSPMTATTTWAEFFRQLTERFASSSGRAQVMAQSVMTNMPAAGGGIDVSAIPTGDGVDLYYHGIGRQTLAEGEALTLPLAAAGAEYERIVEWVVPDTRDEYGRYYQDYYRQEHPDQFEDAAWDALRLRNPFGFPMTTGPAMIVAGGRFHGQRLSAWVNPGEAMTLRITKALSIRTLSSEREEEDSREIVTIGGRKFRHPRVQGTLEVTNHREEAVVLVIRRQFSGELIEADGEPERTLRERGVYSINPRNELTWTIRLKAGECRELRYRYRVLVYH